MSVELAKPKQCDECRTYRFRYTEWSCGCVLCYDCNPVEEDMHRGVDVGVIHNPQSTEISTGASPSSRRE